MVNYDIGVGILNLKLYWNIKMIENFKGYILITNSLFSENGMMDLWSFQKWV